jgi:hypothetical protein
MASRNPAARCYCMPGAQFYQQFYQVIDAVPPMSYLTDGHVASQILGGFSVQ